MRVGRHLNLRMALLRGRRLLLLAGVSAAFVWTYPSHSLSPEDRLGMLAPALLGVWLVARLAAALLGIPKPRPRCPHCAHKIMLTRGMRSCPTCNVSFSEKVRRKWGRTSPVQSPWITRPHTLRMGQMTRR